MADLSAQLRDVISGSYAIDREIGRGGMATVYLARDVRHNRKVALKVLNPELGAVLGVERFLSEIQVTANLQHPNLLPLFDSGQANGLLYYVMPYVQGESLRARLEREKQLPIDEAIHIATAVASALDYAHRHGVIHRDLKPENILLHEGQPMVADFGIALAVSNAGGHRITQTGLSLGTPQYMSPEQATGDRVVDARSDVYSLGAVTYEMLTGEAPHTGNTAQAIIAKVITDKPRSIRLSRDTVPPHVERAVECALAKLPADRFATAHEFADALIGKQVVIPAGVSTPASFAYSSDRRTRSALRLVGVPLITGIAVVAIAVAAWALTHRSSDDGGAARFALTLQPGEHVGGGIGHAYAISPDGRLIAYVSSRPGRNPLLYLRAVDDLRVREVNGTEGADQPTFSSDGKWIAFIAGGSLKKVPIEGGTPTMLGMAPAVRGVAWSPRGDFVTGTNAAGLFITPASGGTPRPLTKVDFSLREQDHRWPHILPDGKTIVFTVFSGSVVRTRLAVVSIDGGPIERLEVNGTQALGVIEGQLVYVTSAGVVSAIPFDASSHRVRGSPAPRIGDVFVNIASGATYAALSPTGNLVYETGAQKSQLVLSDARGNARALLPGRDAYSYPRFSPDGQRIAVGISGGGGTDVWVFDRKLGTIARLTSDGLSERPEWNPDGTKVIYRSIADATIVWQAADHSAAAQSLFLMDSVLMQEGMMSPSGEYIMIRGNGPKAAQDILYRRITPGADTTVHALMSTPVAEFGARFSPDSRWVAYSSDESGTQQVFVTPFPGPGPHYQVSIDGGTEPVWARDGRRLFYIRGRTMMSVAITYLPKFGITRRDSLFVGNFFFPVNHANYDIAPNGKDFLLLQIVEADQQPVFVYNWKAELRAQRSQKP